MPSKPSKPKPALKQSFLQFGSRKSGKAAADSIGKQAAAAATSAAETETHQPLQRDVHVISDDSDIEEFTAAEQEPSEVEPDEEVEVIEEPEESDSLRAPRRSQRRAAAAQLEKVAEEDDVEDADEEQPPKKKRRTSRRTAGASIEAPADEGTLSSKKGKQTKSAKGKKSVFKSRDGTENSGAVKEDSWEVVSRKIKITTKDSQVANHVDIAAMRKHFGHVREKMGNVKPSMYPLLTANYP